MKLEELIIEGLRYIEFTQNIDSEVINVDLIIEIRKYLFNKTIDWYKEKFEEAYKHDIGITRKKGDGYYSIDGIKYTFDEDMKFDSCILYDEEVQKRVSFNIKDKFLFHFYKDKNHEWYNYYYINEIDHFFTYCINKYLLGKTDFSATEKGLKAIKDAILEFCK